MSELLFKLCRSLCLLAFYAMRLAFLYASLRLNQAFVIIAMLGVLLTHAAADESRPDTVVAGATPAVFGVSDAGDASYSVPLEVPPGPGGFAPRFNLTYGSRQGDGILGVGWRMDGLSVLHRCAAVPAVHARHGAVAFDEEDMLCLDGMPLLAVGGEENTWVPRAEFRTHIETFQRIRRRDEGGYVAIDRMGKHHLYGDKPTARMGDSERTLSWLLSLIRDRAGNEIIIHYAGEDSERHVSKVSYGPNAVVFNYARRAATTSYMSGVPLVLSRRLTGITMFASGELSRVYSFAYSEDDNLVVPPRLIRITECDGRNQCLRPIRFAWNELGESDESLSVTFARRAGLTHGVKESDSARYQTGDFNGDGLTDWYVIGAANERDVVYLNQGDGVFTLATRLAKRDTSVSEPSRYHFADFNGDGATDVYVFRHRHSADVLLLAEGVTTLRFEVKKGVSSGGANCVYARCLRLGDFNGDGRTDVYRARFGDTDEVYLFTEDGFKRINGVTAAPSGDGDKAVESIRMGDFNGDGKTDVYHIIANDADRVFLNLGDGRYRRVAGPPTRVNPDSDDGNNEFYRLRFGDFNGDRLTDVLAMSRRAGAVIWLSHGNGAWSSVGRPYLGSEHPSDQMSDRISRVMLADFNRDGRADIYHVADNYLDGVYLSDMTGASRREAGPHTNTSAARQDLSRFRFGDFNGDGATDVYYLGARYGSDSSRGTLFLNQWSPPMVTGIQSGLWYRLRYQTHRYQTHREAGGDEVQYPQASLPPVWVVAEVESDDGAGGSQMFSYRYGGGRLHLLGYGRIGFAWRERHDTLAGIIERTAYRHDFPYIGAVAGHTVWLEDDGVRNTLSVERRTYDNLYFDEAGSYFAHPERYDKTVFTPDGDEVATVETFYPAWDEHGNPTEITQSVTDGNTFFIKREHRVWDNDDTQWYRSDLRRREVTLSRDGHEDMARLTSMDYDERGYMVSQTTEPEHRLEMTQRYEYDAFGNRVRMTRGGATLDLPAKAWRPANDESRYAYDKTGRFLVMDVNALGQTRRYAHDERTGRVTLSVDEGGRMTKSRFDAWGRLLWQRDVAGVETTVRWLLTLPGDAPPQAAWAMHSHVAGRPARHVLYDNYGRVIQSRTTGFDGRPVVEDTTYNARGQPILQLAARYAGEPAYATRYEYDLLGRVTLKETPSPTGDAVATMRMAYAADHVIRVDEQGDERTVYYDLLGRVISVHAEDGGEMSRHYDAAGRLVSIRSPTGEETRLTYDVFHRVTGVMDTAERTVAYERDAFGRLVSTRKPDGSRQYIGYDPLGRVVLRMEPEGDTHRTYDLTSQGVGRLGRESYLGHTRLFAYDDSGRLIEIEERLDGNDGYRVNFDYDRHGRLGRVRRMTGDGIAVIVNRGYNRHGYFDSVSGPPLVSFQDDEQISAALSLSVYQMRANFYRRMADVLPDLRITLRSSAERLDAAARALKVDGAIYGAGSWPLALGYFRVATHHLSDASDLVADMPLNCVKHCAHAEMARQYIDAARANLDKAGEHAPAPHWMPQLADDGDLHYWRVLARDARGRVIKSRAGNGLLTESHYVPGTDYVARVVHALGEQTVSDLVYRYDNSGNLIGRDNQADGLQAFYDYDALGRLVSASSLDDRNDDRTGLFIHDYDEAGRPLWRSGVGRYAYDSARPSALSAAGEVDDYQYDEAGRLIAGGELNVAWRSYDQPAFVRRGDAWSAFRYDGNRRRVEQTLSDGKRVTYVDKLYERVENNEREDGTTEHRHYIYAGASAVLLVQDIERGGTLRRAIRYLHYDAQGSVDSVTDGVGRVVDRLTYGPFGERHRRGETNMPLLVRRGFTGHEHLDNLALIHMNGRLYDPSLGRFLSPDPFVASELSTQGYDRYGYAYNNPFKYSDPSGFFFKKIFKSIRRAVKGVVRSVTTRPQLLLGIVAGYYAGVWATQYSVKSALSNLVFSPAAMASGSYMAAVNGALGSSAVIGGIVGGAVAGWVSGGNVADVLTGAVAGGSLGVLGNHYGAAWSAERIIASATINGLAAEIGGGKFSAAALASLGGMSLKYAAWTMRQRMIAQSMLNPDNAGGISDGLGSDKFKLGGSRMNMADASPGVLGGHQGGEGSLFGVPYAPGSWQDKLIEAYAGPHDYLNSGYWYDGVGNVNVGISGVGHVVGTALNWANLAVATPFVAAWATPDYMYAVSASL